MKKTQKLDITVRAASVNGTVRFYVDKIQEQGTFLRPKIQKMDKPDHIDLLFRLTNKTELRVKTPWLQRVLGRGRRVRVAQDKAHEVLV